MVRWLVVGLDNLVYKLRTDGIVRVKCNSLTGLIVSNLAFIWTFFFCGHANVLGQVIASWTA